MTLARILLRSFVFVIALCASTPASAGWSWNLGYHNPPTSTLGINFMHLWSNWAFEIGVGSLDSKKSNSDTTNSSSENTSNTVSVGGDMNLKYLFSSGWFRPYLQGGVMMGTAANSSGAGVGTGSGFFGGGLLLKGNPFYFYIGANVIGGSTDAHAGLGFDF